MTSASYEMSQLPARRQRPRRAIAPRRVLVVDDCPMVRDLAAMLLRHEGLDVTTVATLQAARRALARPDYDVVVSDFELGGSDTGLHVLAEIERLPSCNRPAFILMSGRIRDDVDPRQELKFLPKPFDARRFRSAVLGVCNDDVPVR